MKISIRQKIAVTFSVLAGILVLTSTLVTFFIVLSIVRSNSYAVLEASVVTLKDDASAEGLTSKVTNYQREVAQDGEESSNVFESGYLDSKIQSSDDLNIEQLNDSRQVHSRVIAENGDVEYTSDLFDTYAIDPGIGGRQEHNYGPICIYSLTVKAEDGPTIQVANYCPISAQVVDKTY